MIGDDEKRDFDPSDYDYAAGVEARRLARGEQTPEQHMAEAIEVLRDVLDDPHTKPADRVRAASDLAKLTANSAATGPRSLLAYSDDELMAFIAEGRAARVGGTVSEGTPAVAADTRVPVLPRIDPTPLPYWKQQAADDFPFDLEASLAGIADKQDFSELM